MSLCAILLGLSADHQGAKQANVAQGGHIGFSIGDEMVRGWQQCEAALRHSAVSKSICISGADCEAPAGAV